MNFVQQNNKNILDTPALNNKSLASWLPVILLMIIAAGTRLKSTWDVNYLLVGGDGPYYPLQVKTFLEHGRMALPDMPLLFMFEAFVAKMLQCFTNWPQADCIIMAVKLSDAFLPPLAAIPVFLMAKELNRRSDIKAGIINYIMVAFSILNNTTVLSFSSGLQKNAVAVVLVFFYLYFIIRIFSYSQKRDYYLAMLTLLICALTHFGSFSVMLFISVAIVFFRLLYRQWHFRRFKTIALAIAVLIVLFSIIGIFDLNRFQRLVNIPLKVFEYPVFLLILKGYDVSNYINPLNLVLLTPLVLLAAVLIVLNRKILTTSHKILAWSMVVVALFLISPFIGLDWANRFYMMAYIPVVVLYLVLFNDLSIKWIKILPLFVFSLLVILSVFGFQPSMQAITPQAYEEFSTIKNSVVFSNSDVIIGRQDLRLLGSWEFGTRSAADYLVTKEDFKKYNKVYVIRQLKGSNFSPGRFRGDAEIPGNSIRIYHGEHFELYQINNSNSWIDGKGQPPKARGIIFAIGKNRVDLRGFKNNNIKTVEISENTLLHLQSGKVLNKGMAVEIDGSYKPFSLNIVADEVTEITLQP